MAASDTQLECSAIVDVGFPAHPEFVTESRGSKFSRGQGLPGRVWANHQTAWIWDVTQDANFPRAEVAQREGLQGTLEVPILSGQALVGVMEIFSAEPIATNQEFLVAIQVISTRIEQ